MARRKAKKADLLGELRKRAGKREFRLEEFCFDKQLAFIQDTSKRKTAVCSRRAGKSVGCAADLVHTALNGEGDVAYITLNRRSAKRIIWRELLKIDKEFELGAKIDNQELTLSFANGNMVHISGAKDEGDLDKLRGMALRKIYIDECQSFKPYLEYLIDEVLEPSLLDYDGSLILIGTPGPVPAGYFYEQSQNRAWSHHAWTMQDNPWIRRKSGKNPAVLIKEIAERRGVSLDDPSILREFYGQWVRDNDALVYKFNRDINTFINPPQELNYIFGIDIGWQDSDAIAVLGFNEHDKHVYLVEEFVAPKLTISDLVEHIKYLQTIYEPTKMVMDAGALGKKIQEEIRQRHKLSVHAAEKTRKHEFIELLNDDLRNSRFKAYDGSRFEQDSYLVQWDYSVPGRPRISDTYHTDIGDAVLYAWRECRHYLYQGTDPGPRPGTDAFMDVLERHEADKLAKKLERAKAEQIGDDGWVDYTDPYFDDFD